MSRNYIHVSFDEVSELIPRIPKSRCDGEDDTIKRICCSTSIRGALSGVPGSGDAVQNLINAGIPVIIHVYLLKASAGSAMNTSEIARYVPDATLTGEVWLTEKPESITRRDYEIYDPVFCKTQDDRPYIVGCGLRRVKHQDNWDRFWHRFCKETKMPEEIRKAIHVPYRLMAQNLNKGLLTSLVEHSDRKE